MKCPVCGTENNNRFCTQCGTELQPTAAAPFIQSAVAKKPNYKPLIGGTILLACILVFVLLIVNGAKARALPYLECNGEIYKYGMDIELPPNTTITTITYNADSSEETVVRYFSPDYDTRIYLDINEKTGNHVIVGFVIEDSSTASIGGLSVGDTYAKIEKKHPKIDHYMLDVEWAASWTSDFLGTEITDHEKQYGKRSYVAVWDENEYALFFMSNKKYDGKKFVKAYPKIHPEQVLHVTTRHNGYVESISFGDFSIYKRAKNIEDLWPW